MLIFCKKNAENFEIKRALALKGTFSEATYVCVLNIPNFKFLTKF